MVVDNNPISGEPIRECRCSPESYLASIAAKQRSLLILAGAVLFFLFVILFCRPHYQTNDDIGILLLAQGLVCAQKPDPHLLFTHIFLGNILSSLYTANPHLPWYVLYLYGCHFIAFVSLSTQFLRGAPSAHRILSFCTFACAVEFYFLTNLQFTTVSFMLGVAGLMLFADWIENVSNSSWRQTWKPVAAFFFFVLSTMVRFYSFLMLMPFAALYLFYVCAGGGNSKRKMQIASVFLGISCAMAFALNYQNNHCYSEDPAFSRFYRDSASSGLIRDYNRPIGSEKAQQSLKKIGWTDNDVAMIRGFIAVDPVIFSSEKLAYFSRSLPSYRADLSVSDILSQVKQAFVDPVLFPIFLATIYFLCNARDRRWIAFFLLLFTVELFLIFALVLFLKLPQRVYFSFFAATCIFSLFSVLDDKASESNKKQVGIALTALIATLCLTLTANWPLIRERARGNKVLKTEMKLLNPTREQLYVVLGGAYPYEYILPFDDTAKFFSSFRVIGLGCTNHTDLPYRALASFGLKQFFIDFVDNPRVFLIASNPDSLNVLKIYLREHYKVDADFVPVKDKPLTSFCLFKVCRRKRPI